MAVGKRQRLCSGVRMLTGNFISSTPLRTPGALLELKPMTWKEESRGPLVDTWAVLKMSKAINEVTKPIYGLVLP
jgi:hypothetical protein